MKCKNCKNVVPREGNIHVKCIIRRGAWFHPESEWQCSDYEHNGEEIEEGRTELWDK